MTEMSYDLLGFLGRLHPLLVHLPIGFITFLAVIEAAVYWVPFKEAVKARRLLLFVSVISAIVTAGCGWILSRSGGYAEETLVWHKWLGMALVPVLVVLQVLLRRGNLVAYRLGLGLSMVLLIFVGEYGNILVRGEGYLFRKDPVSATGGAAGLVAEHGVRKDSEPTAFASLIQPIFNDYCIHCHGAEKSKAKLRLDTAENLFKGSESGPVVQPGSIAQSLLIKRLHLPLDDDDHMPPSGKKQPGAQEIALLEWWINVGAPVDKTVNDLRMPEVK